MLSIIIVNWNTKQLTLQCISSIRKYVGDLDHEIILIDNASTDGSQDVFSRLDDINLILNRQNYGFAKANNVGMQSAQGDVYLLLNSDTLILDNAIQQCYQHLLSHPDVGMVGCKLLNGDRTLQRSCSYFPRLLTPILGKQSVSKFKRKIFPFLTFQYDSAYLDEDHKHLLSPDWIMGAFMMVRQEAVKQVGMLDEDYFMYAEDMDWCYRFKRAGWQIQYIADAAIVHLGGGSSSIVPRKTLARHVASTLLYFCKHHGSLYSRLYALTSIVSLTIELMLRLITLSLVYQKNRQPFRQILLKLYLMCNGLVSRCK